MSGFTVATDLADLPKVQKVHNRVADEPRLTQTNRVPFGMAPRFVLRDASLSPMARLVYMILDERVGAQDHQRVSQELLAKDVGTTTRTIRRAITELELAGLVHKRRTGRTDMYFVRNPARSSAPVAPQESLIGHECPDRLDISVQSTEKEPLEKQASKHSSAYDTEQAVTAEPLLDPFEVEAFLESLPVNLRPDHTLRLSKSLSEAANRGWTAVGIAEAIRKRITNPDARAGLTIKILGELAQQRADEHTVPETPTPTAWKDLAAAPRCDHGEVVGRCALCRWAEQGLTNGIGAMTA
jgi:Fe2+ or Zn2+ uptake regulation protein